MVGCVNRLQGKKQVGLLGNLTLRHMEGDGAMESSLLRLRTPHSPHMPTSQVT